MRSAFRGYYRHSQQDFAELWKDCFFVVDTNVLLNLYRYPQGARDDLFKVLSEVSSRLWIPHQVALEYQENRLTVIAEQVKKFDEVRLVLRKCLGDLESGLTQLQLERRHSAIETEGFLKQIKEQFADFQLQLNQKESEQPGVLSDDTLRDRIDELLSGRVGECLPEKDLAALYKEGEQRFVNKRPPGYEDRGKAKDSPCYFARGATIRREYGDLIIWKQIIAYALATKLQYLIFVTDDDKEDWWWIVDSKGKKTIGPRPELTDELMENSQVKLFHMYNTDRLLHYAGQYLGMSIKQESIEQAQEIRVLSHQSSEFREDSHGAPRKEIYQAISDWLRRTIQAYSVAIVEDIEGEGGVDLIASTPRGNIGFQVEVISTVGTRSIPVVTRRFGERRGLQHKFNLIDIRLLVVLFPVDAMWPTVVALVNQQISAAKQTGVSFGYLTEGEENGRHIFIFVPVSPAPLIIPASEPT